MYLIEKEKVTGCEKSHQLGAPAPARMRTAPELPRPSFRKDLQTPIFTLEILCLKGRILFVTESLQEPWHLVTKAML
jgi:hypothetical protein